MVPNWRRIKVDATSSRRMDVQTTSFLRRAPAGHRHGLYFEKLYTIKRSLN